MSDLEESLKLQLDFEKLKKITIPVIPVIAQDYETKEVLIVGYANQVALDHTLKHRVAAFWSTSRNELWIKGDTSGDYLDLVEIRVNCEQNSLLYLVKPRKSGACHTKDKTGKTRKSCFYRRVKDLDSLEEI